MKTRIKSILNRVFGIKLIYRMFLVYLIGGLLPMLIISFYLISGENRILVQEAENSETEALREVKYRILDIQNVVSRTSRFFYFDERLEKIAQTQYTDYQELVDDYKDFDAFVEYRKYYNHIISRIGIYLQNETIRKNSNFMLADEEIKNAQWYQNAYQKRGVVSWTLLPDENNQGEGTLVLNRMIRTKTSEDVGVLVISIRPECLEELIRGRDGCNYILLNQETVVCSAGEGISQEELFAKLPQDREDEWQKRITLGNREYIMTGEIVRPQDSEDYLQIVSVHALDDILTEANRQHVKSLYLLCGSVVLALTLIFVFSYYFGHRVGYFKEQMQKASEGNFELGQKLGGTDEISQLYDYLGDMIWKIQSLLAEVYREKIHAEELKIRQKDAELKMLTSQINPHFLYNTLETIRMKARVNGQQEIEELAKMLGKILRSSIQAGEKEVALRTEIELVECYLKIQKYRFGDKIRYFIEVEEGLWEMQILSLLLQPLVENAVIHGLEEKEEGGQIIISAQSREDEVVLTVRDDGIGIGPEQLEAIQKGLKSRHFQSEHIGIINVCQRVRLKYGDAFGVDLSSAEGSWTEAQIHLPGENVKN